jgi:hypothetical protein
VRNRLVAVLASLALLAMTVAPALANGSWD